MLRLIIEVVKMVQNLTNDMVCMYSVHVHDMSTCECIHVHVYMYMYMCYIVQCGSCWCILSWGRSICGWVGVGK